ncbi:MAG: hypothetical protein ACSHWS_01765 [Sulfitobacter sp.]
METWSRWWGLKCKKGVHTCPFMQEKTQDELVGEVVNRLLGVRNFLANSTILGHYESVIDISKPNIHDNKAEFVKERDAIVGAIEKLEQALKFVLPDKDDAKQSTMVARLSEDIDQKALRALRRKADEQAYELAMRNIVQTGFYYNFLFINMRMIASLRDRLKELHDQELQFWSVPYRAPNYYARTIAVRLARVYAAEKRKVPTFGTSRDGGHPSTEYGRALEDIFQILGIKARVSNAAKWALGQLTEDDVNPPPTGLMGGLLGYPSTPTGSKETKSLIAAMLDSGKKGA